MKRYFIFNWRKQKLLSISCDPMCFFSYDAALKFVPRRDETRRDGLEIRQLAIGPSRIVTLLRIAKLAKNARKNASLAV